MRLSDTLSGELRELEPGADGVIGMYACGPTVYTYAHIGNARPFVVFMQLKRFLEWRGQPVRLVHNITDVNDKIYAAARASGERSDEVARRYAAAYIEDTDRFGLGRPDAEPLASESIDDIVALIAELIERGYAYESDGDVYYRVRRFGPYGRLSRQRVDALREGARIEPGERKEDALDFTLWKANKPDEDTWWPSPWGNGRPGWHIECSAMAERQLGAAFAVHGGGRDLVFPHHENEIAQSEAAGREFARVWAHNGMLTLAGEKMSKSAGGFDPIRDALDEWGGETLLMLFLQAHYASPVEYSESTLGQARASVETLRNAFRAAQEGDGGEELEATIVEALENDFSTPRALAAIFEADLRRPGARAAAAKALDVLGLGGLTRDEEAPADLVELAHRREEARARRDFAEADALRAAVEARGFELRDTPDGPRLYRRA